MRKRILLYLFAIILTGIVNAQSNGDSYLEFGDKILQVKLISLPDSTYESNYEYNFKPGRILGEIAGGIALGFVGMTAGGLISSGFTVNESGEFAGLLETVIGAYIGYCLGAAGGVTLVSKNYNSNATFFPAFAAAAGGAVIGLSILDWEHGWTTGMPFVMPLVISIISSEIFFPSRVDISVTNSNIFYYPHRQMQTNINIRISLN